jgi:signal transduction protein with GAF and PtsI domain
MGERPQEFQVLRRIIETVNSTLKLQVVFEEILQLVAQVTAADACLLYLFDEATHTLVLHASRPPHPDSIGRISLQMGEGLTGWVAKERRPVIIDRQAFDDPRFKLFQQLPEDRYEAFLSVPIITRERLVGVINVQHRAPHHHTAKVVALAETIGRLVGGAIANARLYEAAGQRRRELDTLARVSEAAVSERYLDEILQLIVTVTAELMNSKICSLMLLDEAKQVLVIRATQALSPAYRNKPPIKVGQSISGQAVKERRPISVLDVTTNNGYMYPELAKREALRSLLSVPMLVQERPIGVINCYTSSEHRFSDDEVRVLCTIAHQAAGVIERTRLLDEAVTAREALKTRKLVERAKDIVAQATSLGGAAAFRLLQQQSMEKRKSLREIAEAIILAHELKATELKETS